MSQKVRAVGPELLQYSSRWTAARGDAGAGMRHSNSAPDCINCMRLQSRNLHFLTCCQLGSIVKSGRCGRCAPLVLICKSASRDLQGRSRSCATRTHQGWVWQGCAWRRGLFGGLLCFNSLLRKNPFRPCRSMKQFEGRNIHENRSHNFVDSGCNFSV